MDLPDPTVTKDLVSRYAQLRALLAPELGALPLVLPNGGYFPDVFEPTEAGLNRLLRRMQGHAGIADIPIEGRVTSELSSTESQSSCSSGACAPAPMDSDQSRIIESGDGWVIQFAPAELRHPVGLTTVLARSLSAIVLEEVRGEHSVPSPAALSYDLAGVQLGFGVLLLEGSYIYSKSCGGPSIAKLTALSTPELAVAVALFAATEDHSLGPAKRIASPTQKAALGLAEDLIASNRALVRQLKKSPNALASADFRLAPIKNSWFGLFNKRKRSSTEELADALLHGQLDEEQMALLSEELGSKTRRELPTRTSAGARSDNGANVGKQARPSQKFDDELKQLVSESLSESRAG